MNHGNRGSLEILSTQPRSTTNADFILNIPSMFTCSICFTDYYRTPEITSSCSRNHNFCKACFTEYLEHLISESNAIKIVCPQDGCMETVEVTFIKQLVSTPLLEKYKIKLQTLQNIPDPTQIICQKPNCKKTIKISRTKEFTICQCGTKICNKCQNYCHKDKTCLQAINEELGEFSKNNEIRLCTNCKVIVTKIEGCQHITCSVCKSDWCWDCGEQYLPGHPENCRKTFIPTKKTVCQRLKENFCAVVTDKFIIFVTIAVLIIVVVPIIVSAIAFPNEKIV